MLYIQLMKTKIYTLGILACALLAFSSCSNDEDNNTVMLTGSDALLTIATRGIGDANTIPADGRVYVFNSAGKCVSLLTTNTTSPTATTKLAAGTYTLCCLGASDLSPYSLPERVYATASTLISLKAEQEMNELFMKSQSVTLTEGEQEVCDIELTRAISQIEDITITQVPTSVSAISVEIGDVYTAVQLDGGFPATGNTETLTFALEEQADGTTWKATPNKMVFPSKGNPTLTMIITTDEGVDSYSFQLASAIQANKHTTFTGQYKVPLGATLQCTMYTTDWDSPQAYNFDVDPANEVFKNLTQGTFHNGYYVVSLDATAHTAVLLAKEEIAYEIPTTGVDDNTNPLWLQNINTAMAALEKPTGITSSWRLPTLAEADIFLRDSRVEPLGATTGGTRSFFCTEDNALKWTWLKTETSALVQKKGTKNFSYTTILLLPVIDITF